MAVPDPEDFPPAFHDSLSPSEIGTASTLHDLGAIRPHLTLFEERASEIETILALGCGEGGFLAGLADHLDADRTIGIDRDTALLAAARSQGVTTICHDLDRETGLPLETASVDLVIAFGLIEHLRYYDVLFEEIGRILETGYLWISCPDLGGWINRIGLLFGYQPRNVELSRRHAVGVLPVYDRSEFLNHVHAPTYRALCELLSHHGYSRLSTVPLAPYQTAWVAWLLDSTLGRFPTLARRIALVAER